MNEFYLLKYDVVSFSVSSYYIYSGSSAASSSTVTDQKNRNRISVASQSLTSIICFNLKIFALALNVIIILPMT